MTTTTPATTFTTRAALLLLGLVSLAAGLWLVVGHVAVRPTSGLRARLPGWWPLPRADAGATGAYAWWAPAVLAALALALLLGVVRLLVPVVRSARSRARLPLGRPGLWLQPSALRAVLASRTADVAGVRGARVALGRAKHVVHVRLTVDLEPCAAPGEVLREVEAGPLAAVRAALAPTPVRAEVRLGARRRGTRRAR
ncbi:hypothetical protein [Streptomyces cremeus]|uniref:Alkaline shock response membrane anchor protein AmaP n=1 Tax=Streptomyces cremeus TaxID=66881 RepID=A0ABV5PE33_STRCM